MVFTGEELVTWLVNNGSAETRADAVEVGKTFVKADLCHHIYDQEHFRDSKNVLYRFRHDEADMQEIVHKQVHAKRDEGPSAVVASQGCGMKGMLLKKGRSGVRWNNRYFVLRSEDSILYYYDSEVSPHPRRALDLTKNILTVNECGTCKKGSYCFRLLEDTGLSHVICANKSSEQEAWIDAIVAAGTPFQEDQELKHVDAKSIFEFKSISIDHEEVDMSVYAGKVCLIVNGLTPVMYPQLQELYEKYKDDGFVVIGFPCNQFGAQEPGTHAQIKEFVKQFNISFPMMHKIKVNGNDAHPIYKFLRARLGGTMGSLIKWNFTKFLCDRNGIPVKRFSPPTKPLDFEKDIVELLKEPVPENLAFGSTNNNNSGSSDTNNNNNNNSSDSNDANVVLKEADAPQRL